MASMAFGFVLAIFLLVVAFRVKSATANCDRGWFGPDCAYQCHCKNRLHWACNQINGLCTFPSQCEEGFAGTACQYADLAYKQIPTGDLSPTDRGSLEDLTDGDTTTCFGIRGKENGSTWGIQLKEPSWIHTISILLQNKTARAEDLEVSILSDNDTHVAARPKPTDVRYNYHLPRPVRGSRVQIRTLSNETALSLCDVNVLGGRNVALKKSATQGEATYVDGVASRAVDGNRNDDFDKGSCSHTDDVGSGRALRSWWRVSLANQQHIWRVKVYNRAGETARRLGGFIVNVTYSNGSSSEVYRNPDIIPPDVVDMMLPNTTNPDPVVGIELTIWHSGVGKMLTLCEVEVFGDCLRGYFGWQCESECRCENSNEVCDTLWGACPVSGCKTGWRGGGCLQECFNGTFGYGCKSSCSATCVDDMCHHVTGECTNGCAPGWQGEYCNNKCSATMFGQNCSEACLPGCLKKQCHHVTGECTGGCGAGWTGNNCTETCSPGFHGVNCSVPCSLNCLNTTCDATSGDCTHGCVLGTRCETSKVTGNEKTRDEEEEKERLVVVGVILAILVLILLGLLVAVVVWMRRRPKLFIVKPSLRSGERDISRAALLNPKADVTDKENNSDPLKLEDFLGVSVIEEHRKPVPAPRGVNRRKETREEYELCELTPKSKKVHSVITEEDPSEEGQQPCTKRPELMALFSRDAPDFPSSSTKPPKVESSPLSRRATTHTPAKRIASLASLDTLSVDDLEIVHMTSTLMTSSLPSTADASDYYNIACRDFSPNTVILLSDLPAKVAAWLAEPRHFNRERSMLPPGNVGKCEIATLPQNIKKNRYRDVYPYDQSRVVLNTLPEDPYSDYYNACYIDGYNTEKEYIAAQGPLEKTVSDFLRMVWDVNCRLIIMLTNTVELGRFKCYQYWPDEGSVTHGEITVTILDTTAYADFCIRSLFLHRDDETRPVTVFHYTAWPDNFAPASPWSLIHFRRKVRQMEPEGGPSIVHCSAGIGRTGTYLALDIMLARAEHEDKVDVFTCVWKLRQQRICMVQTLAQYIFIHEALAAALTTSCPIPVADFHLDSLLEKQNGDRLLEKEYKNLNLCLSPTLEKDKNSGDAKARRSPAELLAVPRDMDRVQVLSSDGTFSSVFVNAIFLSSYKEARAFIQTHTPLEGSVVDFLSMMLQHNVTSVVCLDTAHDFNEAGVVVYWPKVTNKALSFGPYCVRLLQTTPQGWITVWNIRITYCPPASAAEDYQEEGAEAEYARDVTLYTCTQWPQSRITPPSVSAFFSLVSSVHPTEQEPVLVHCKDGHTRSGLFCVAATILERMHEEDHVAVSDVTAHMRVPRRENIVSVEQYEFLYKCVQKAIEREDALSNTAEGHTYSNVDTAKPDNEGHYENMDTPVAEDRSNEAQESDHENHYGNIDTPVAEDRSNEAQESDHENHYGNVGTPVAEDPDNSSQECDSENHYGNVDTVRVKLDADIGVQGVNNGSEEVDASAERVSTGSGKLESGAVGGDRDGEEFHSGIDAVKICADEVDHAAVGASTGAVHSD